MRGLGRAGAVTAFAQDLHRTVISIAYGRLYSQRTPAAMFGVSDHSAERLRHDINTILEAIARLLAKVDLPKVEQPLPPVQMRAELVQEDPGIVTDVEVIEEPDLLTGVESDLLTGRDRPTVPAVPPPALLEPETHAQVQLQIGNTRIIALLPDSLQSQLEQLSPQQIETLQQAMTEPVSEAASGHADAEVIDVNISGIQRLHQTAQGQITVNDFYSIVSKMQSENIENLAQSGFLRIDRGQYMMLLNQEMSQETSGTLYFTLPGQDDVLYEYEGDLDEALDELPEIYEEAQQRSIPYLELRPAAEVEALVGQQLSDSSAVHQQVLHQAPVVQVVVDQEGQIKPGSYLRDQIEPTEDEVEREQLREPSLTPEAAIVVEQIWEYFDRTGAQGLEGEHDYDFQVEGDHLLVLPKGLDGEVVAIDRNGQVESTFAPERYEYLMDRFAIAYEQIQIIEHQQSSNSELEPG